SRWDKNISMGHKRSRIDISPPSFHLLQKKKRCYSMKTLLRLQKQLYPEIVQEMQERYTILHSIRLLQPIGRRGLAQKVGQTERIVRKEIDFLERQQFIEITTKGMFTTPEGKKILEELSPIMHEVMGIRKLERQLKERFKIEKVMIVAGNSDDNEWIKQ